MMNTLLLIKKTHVWTFIVGVILFAVALVVGALQAAVWTCICLVLAVASWITSFAFYLKATKQMDEDFYFTISEGAKFSLRSNYAEYLEVLNSKRKYSTWYGDWRKHYNPVGEKPESHKKDITLDMQYSLVLMKRNATHTSNMYISVLIPAELSFVALVCTNDVFPGASCVIAATVLIAVITLLLSVSLSVKHNIVSYVNDVAKVLNISIDDK